MGRVEKFEDLIAWQKARELTKQIYFVSGNGSFAKDWGLKDQIRRASVSIMSIATVIPAQAGIQGS